MTEINFEELEIYLNKNTSTDIIKKNILKIIKDRICHHKVRVLYLIRELFKNNIKNYLEIGVHNGSSMSYVLSSKYKINCYGIDLFENTFYKDELNYNKIKKNLDLVNKYEHNIELIKGNSNDVKIIEKIKNLNIKFDIIFIDGDHSYNGVKNDFINYEKFLNNNGLLIFDDYNKASTNKGVYDFINEFLIKNKNYKYIKFYDNEHNGEFKDGIIIIKKLV